MDQHKKIFKQFTHTIFYQKILEKHATRTLIMKQDGCNISYEVGFLANFLVQQFRGIPSLPFISGPNQKTSELPTQCIVDVLQMAVLTSQGRSQTPQYRWGEDFNWGVSISIESYILKTRYHDAKYGTYHTFCFAICFILSCIIFLI